MKDIRICFIGDSFVNGTGDPEKLGWCGRVCSRVTDKSLDITYYNLGIRRETSSDIKERWEAEVSSNDGAHPRDKGYALLADLVLSWERWWYR